MNYMGNVVEDLKKQMQIIQYYSLLQKLFISYVFKQLEGQIDNVTKNNQSNNFNNYYKPNQKFQSNPNQTPVFGQQEMEFMNHLNMGNMDKEQMNFMKQMQNSGFNFSNFMGNNQPEKYSSGISGLDQNASNQSSNNFTNNNPNNINNPKELLKNLYSSINCQMNNSNI